MEWRTWLAYPEYIPETITKILDTIAQLIDPVLIDDRYSAIMAFVDNALSDGLITSIESDKIKYHIAQNL